jgi:[ribosomal protein S5]-alanine N-acetyltransferase
VKSEASSTHLESLTSRDRDALIRLWTEPSVRTYLGGVLVHAQAEARANEMIADITNAKAIRNRIDHGDNLLGLVTVGSHCDLQEPEVSYLLLPEFCGFGYASQAVALACELIFTSRGVSRVIAETQTANLASIRLLERLGFTHLYACDRFEAKQSVYELKAPQ